MPPIRIEPWLISRASSVDDLSESVFFTGNGHIGIRGFPGWEEKARPDAHAIFRAGLFSHISRHVTDMVQLPDVLTLYPQDSAPEEVLQELDLRTGVLSFRWETADFRFCMRRTACMADSQLLLVSLTATAKRDAELRIRAAADAQVKNLPVHDDQMVESKDLVALLQTLSIGPDGLKMRTIAEGTPLEFSWRLTSDRDCIRTESVSDSAARTELYATVPGGCNWTVEKRVRVLVGGEAPNSEAADPWGESRKAWVELWESCDVEMDADDGEYQGAIRYNVFQMLCSNAADDPDVSIGARGLTHGRYKGNTFWDTEIFMLPFFMWTRPSAARNLLLYRARRLNAAKALANKQNLDGARFPWMCSADGTEQCETWDIGLCEVHVTADVAYAMDRYVQATGDTAFLREYAAGVYGETAQYWLSRLTWEPGRRCFSSFFVKGPDEYCGAAINNTYTNWMARHNLALAARHCGLEEAETQRVRHAMEHIAILYDRDRRLYLQDETFERLEPAPFLKGSDGPSYKAVCFDRMQRYRVIKQADLVLLTTLFPDSFTAEEKENIFRAYEPLTLHDSTLSWGIHALLALRLGMWEKAGTYFRKALLLDLRDVMGNTGHEGIHMAALGAAWQAVVYGMAGLWSDESGLSVRPMLPPGICRLQFKVYYHGERYRIEVSQNGHTVHKEEV